MPLYRVQVAAERGADLDIDDAVNTFYLQDIGPTSNPDALANDAATLWANRAQWPTGITAIRARIYDMAHVPPRLPIANQSALPVGTVSGGPREVALCLSFYASVNQPRRRGRLYIGPWGGSVVGYERPPTAVTTAVQTLAEGIGNLGGVDVDWMQFSPTTGLANKVTNWWIDNEWDTVRSRGLKGTSRISGVTQE